MREHLVPVFAKMLAEKAGLVDDRMSYDDLVKHALWSIKLKRKNKAETVCGPITTGGYDHPGINVLQFNHAIELLEFQGRPMFNQIPYEYRLAQLESAWKATHGHEKYCHPILEEFYLPLFKAGVFARAWFLPRWETSVGAKWEHEQLKRLECPIMYLREDWIYSLDVTKMR